MKIRVTLILEDHTELGKELALRNFNEFKQALKIDIQDYLMEGSGADLSLSDMLDCTIEEVK